MPNDFHIITKVGEAYDKETGSHYDFSEKAIMRSLERSLRHLNRNRLDVVLLHSDGQDIEHLTLGALRTLIKAREQGLVHAVGLSGKTVEGGRLALSQGADCLMITLNPEQSDEKPLIDEAKNNGAGLLVKKALGSGHLTASILKFLKIFSRTLVSLPLSLAPSVLCICAITVLHSQQRSNNESRDDQSHFSGEH